MIEFRWHLVNRKFTDAFGLNQVESSDPVLQYRETEAFIGESSAGCCWSEWKKVPTVVDVTGTWLAQDDGA